MARHHVNNRSGGRRADDWNNQNWDPMEDAYKDPKFNSYNRGIGTQLNAYNKNSGDPGVYTLHVGNITSTQIDEVMLENLFMDYGKPLRVVLRRPANGNPGYAFIEYCSINEATSAIRGLNDKEPYFLKLSFAHPKSSETNKTNEVIPHVESSTSCVVRQPGLGRGCSPRLAEIPIGGMPVARKMRQLPDDREYMLHHDYMSSQEFFRPQFEGQFENANRMLEKRLMVDMGRMIVGGRGCYNLPSRIREVSFKTTQVTQHMDNMVSKGLEKRYYDKEHNGFFESGQEVTLPPDYERGKCACCGSLTSLTCGNCYAVYYCSTDCRTTDWKQHKLKCMKTVKPGSRNSIKAIADSTRNTDKTGFIQNNSNFNSKTNLQSQKHSNFSSKTNTPSQNHSNYNSNLEAQNVNDYHHNKQAGNFYQNNKQNEKLRFHKDNKDNQKFGHKTNNLPNQTIGNKQFGEQKYNRESDSSAVGNFQKKRSEDKPYHNQKEARPQPSLSSAAEATDSGIETKCQSPESSLEYEPKSTFSPVVTSHIEVKSPQDTKQKNLFFNAGEKFEVYITHQKNEFVWLSKVSDLSKLFKLCEDLKKELSDISPLLIPALREKCAAKFEDVWCRAKVVSVHPLMVYFVDYGNTEECKAADLKVLPSSYTELPPLAAKSFIRGGIKQDLADANFTIKAIEKQGVVWQVEVVENNSCPSQNHIDKPLPSEKKEDTLAVNSDSSVCAKRDTPRRPNISLEPDSNIGLLVEKPATRQKQSQKRDILDFFDNNVSVFLEVSRSSTEDPTKFTCSCILNDVATECFTSILNIKLDEMIIDPNFRPDVGEMVITKFARKGNCVKYGARGIILTTSDSKYHVELIDYAIIIRGVTEVFRCSPELKDLTKYPRLGVNLELFSTSPVPILEGEMLIAKCIAENESSWQVEVLQKTVENTRIEINVSGQLAAWKPEVENMGLLSCVKVKSGDRVILTVFRDISTLYVRPVSKESMELNDEITQEVSACCIKPKPLGRDPIIGELVATKWKEDKNAYRSQVLCKKKDRDLYTVTFVDYGNLDDNISPAEMMQLPDNIKKLPCCAIRVGLKGVQKKTFTPAALQLITDLSENGEPLQMIFDNLDEVELKRLNSEISVNEQMKELMEPTWVKQPVENMNSAAIVDYKMRDDLPEPTKLRIGSMTELVLVYVAPCWTSDTKQVVFVNNNSAEFQYVCQGLEAALLEYWESLPKGDRYVPRRGELCVCVGGDSILYRGECIKALESTVLVSYIDWGDRMELSANQIHRMPPDLMQFAPSAIYCYIDGLPPNFTHKEFLKVADLQQKYSVQIVSYKDDHYIIRIPEVMERIQNRR